MTMLPSRKIVEVAVGVIYGPTHKTVLLSSRPQGKVCAGMWEFPGGKVEEGETPAQALVRELSEELAVTCRNPLPWFVMEHEYPHAYVRLNFQRVFEFEGLPKCLEHQQFAWVDEGSLPQPLLPMVELVVKRAFLPEVLIVVEHGDSDWSAPEGVAVGVVGDSSLAKNWAKKRGFRVIEPQALVKGGHCALQPEAQAKLCAVINSSQVPMIVHARAPCYVWTDRQEAAPKLPALVRAGAQGAALKV